MYPLKQLRVKKLFILILFIGAVISIINYYNIVKDSLTAKVQIEFLVSSSKCKIVDLDPFNDVAKRFYSFAPYEECPRRTLFTYVTKNGEFATLHLNTSLISSHNLKNVRCCYSNITRDSQSDYPDDRIIISTCQKFTNSTTIYQDPVLVNCTNDEGFLYENVHVAVTIGKEIKNKLRRSKSKRPLSVLMIAIDSVSRLNFIRTMPSTYNYVESNGWIPLLGYNKMEDNTYPNLMAILTGFDLNMSNEVCNPYVLGKLDACPMIWHNYSEHGYATAYAEGEADLSTFNYARMGFKGPPVDYYFRPYTLATHKLPLFHIDGVVYCAGPETSGERVMNLARDFSVTFKGYPSFGLFWMNSFSHETLNSPTRMDHKIKEFLESLSNEGVRESSIIVFFSDHGIRFGDIRLYNTGWHEERLPFIYFSFPSWFKSEYPRLLNNFKINTNRLTSPYDFYMTLQHILLLEGKISEYKPSVACPTCRSLFDVIPYDRSCQEAGISIHYCACYGYVDINLPRNAALIAAQFVIHEIHSVIRTEPYCLPYKMEKVWRTAIGQYNPHKNETYLLILVETVPKAIFEATLIASDDISLGKFLLAGTISRVDYYGGNDWCTKRFKTLCYCRKKPDKVK